MRNVFADFTALARRLGAINLGQGFPSFGAPSFVTSAAVEAIANVGEPSTVDHNQYTRPGGHPSLVEAVAEFYAPHFNRAIDPMTEVCSCNGAQTGLFLAISALSKPGDEVLTIEPYFDAYTKIARLIGATPKGVPLRQGADGEYALDLAELESAITDRTRLLLLNTPHNPTGKVFTLHELEGIASIVRRHPNIIVVSDEVYEWGVFGGGDAVHHRIATLPGMADRTVSLYSAGKTFSVTGWRVGYAIAPPALTMPMIATQATVAFCSAAPLEVAVGNALRRGTAAGHFVDLPATLKRKSDALDTSLRTAMLAPRAAPEGGYFVVADASGIAEELAETVGSFDEFEREIAGGEPNYELTIALAKRRGVVGIPMAAFYSPAYRHLAGDAVRFAFAKTDAELEAAGAALSASSSK
tara:strand:+ start:197 stop:1435 length:1239 start_codon:yes stop_codon:yes gene_type:complete